MAVNAESRPAYRLSPRARKLVLVTHVISSVGWLGINIGDLALALVGVLTDDPQRQRFAFGGLSVVAELLLIPISLTAFGTGLVLSLATRWGLLRHYWVLIKFGLTLIAVVLIPLSLLPGIAELTAQVSATPPDQLAGTGQFAANVIVAGCVSTTMYVSCAVLSVYKPFGRTKLGRVQPAHPGRVSPVS